MWIQFYYGLEILKYVCVILVIDINSEKTILFRNRQALHSTVSLHNKNQVVFLLMRTFNESWEY